MRIIPRTDRETPDARPGAPRLGRRALLGGVGFGALLGAGAAGAGIGAATGFGQRSSAGDPAAGDPQPIFGGESLPCHGPHQAGIVTPPAAHVRYLAFRLLPETDRDALARMFRILTGDIEGLASGDAPLADPEPELAERPARLTITIGVGAELVDRVNPDSRPAWLAPLPAFERDRLGDGYDDGDLLAILQSDDPLPLSHAARMLQRDLRSFAQPLWTQQGFRQARGSAPDGTTMRNLMGQVDGTTNPSPDDEDFSSLVWLDAEEGGPLAGGSAFVLRRIRMELDTWDMVDRPGREQTIGRTLDTGAPLTGGGEHTQPDFEAKNELGLTVIPAYAHIRRAHSEDPSERIFRRAVNYDDGAEAGLLFGCFQRDPLRQFVPIQRRLDELDLLNEWVTHTGSAVFAILPGFEPGEMLGGALFS